MKRLDISRAIERLDLGELVAVAVLIVIVAAVVIVLWPKSGPVLDVRSGGVPARSCSPGPSGVSLEPPDAWCYR